MSRFTVGSTTSASITTLRSIGAGPAASAAWSGEVTSPDQATLAAGPAPVERKVVMEAVHVEPTVKRDTVYVSVYNNSNITGLAGQTAQRIITAGWQVVATDNWYGTIPATTIYYPERLKDAAMLLSKDLGIERVLPAVDPMSMDRLTLIITSDFA